MLLEGENHHVLEALQFTHAGKVDCIYIDPPYLSGADFDIVGAFEGSALCSRLRHSSSMTDVRTGKTDGRLEQIAEQAGTGETTLTRSPRSSV